MGQGLENEVESLEIWWFLLKIKALKVTCLENKYEFWIAIFFGSVAFKGKSNVQTWILKVKKKKKIKSEKKKKKITIMGEGVLNISLPLKSHIYNWGN